MARFNPFEKVSVQFGAPMGRRDRGKIEAGMSLCAKHQGGHYCHEMTMSLDLDLPDSVSQINFSNAESDLLECFRDLSRWFYRMLESEYDYKTSPEAFAELCESNAYEFDKNGNLA